MKKTFKKDKFLYVIIVGLILLMGGMFCYFQKKINTLEDETKVFSEISTAIIRRLNSVVKYNYLNTESFEYLIDPSDWKESLKNETLLDLENIGNFDVSKVIVRRMRDMGPDDLSEYEIFINISNESSFKDFTDLMYQKINEIFIITNNDTSKVESFKEGKGYYDINSFEEATYNNMYYDYMKTLSDGSTGGPKVKVKILYLEETNQIKMEVNKF